MVLAGVLGATLLQAGTAEAGHVRVGGGVRFSGHFRGGVSVRFARPVVRPAWRPVWRPRVWVRGGAWGYYYPRPYYYYYYPYPEYVPSYSGAYDPPPQVAAPGAVAVAASPPPPLPTFGFGVFAGSTSIQDKSGETTELGLLARIRLTPGLLLEAEVAKDTLKGDVACPGSGACAVAQNGERIDRRIGGSLIWEIAPYNSLAPYLLVGGGVQQAKVSGSDFFSSDFTTTQDYGEIGVGLRLALSRNFHLTADVRAGRRKTIDSNQSDSVVVPLARTIDPPSGVGNNDTEDYTRGRIAAVLNF